MSVSHPYLVGVTTLATAVDPGRFAASPARLAVELRLDRDAGWRRVLDDPRALQERIAWLKSAGAKTSPAPIIIATCRRPRDGGAFDGDEHERLEVLRLCANVCNFVDVESGIRAEVPDEKVIRSLHDFEGIPDDLPGLAARLQGEGAALVKIVGTAAALSDNLRVRDFLNGRDNVAAFLMGEYGAPSRILGMAWGSVLSYGSLTEEPMAPGMIGLAEMANLYRAPKITAKWEVFGVTGGSVAHSRSPELHNGALAKSGQKRVYLPLPARDADDFLRFAEALPLAGASITIPFKQTLLSRCAKLDDDARATGAVNTLVRIKEGWRGRNTDAPGLLDDIKSAYAKPLWGRRALVLGAGGSARAAVYALRGEGARVSVLARRHEQAEELARALGADAILNASKLDGVIDLLVNTTPCGMSGYTDIAVPWDELEPRLAHDALVYDLVYEPKETPLLRAARTGGFDASNGLGMLKRQAALQGWAFGYPMDHGLPAPARTSRHVWLVGYRGAGKSAIARELAIMLRRRSVDLDARIELLARAPVRAIFAERGEAAFRELEARALAEAAAAKPDAVIATGGGAVTAPENIQRMRQSGLVIFLDAPESLLMERLARDDTRPSLTGKPLAEETPEVLAARRPLYERAAHLTFQAAAQNARKQAGAIASILAEFEA